MNGLSMPAAFRAGPYWREYREAFGKEGLRVFATFHFGEWLDANHPRLPAVVEPPVLGPVERRRLARAAILAGRQPRDLPSLLVAGEIERRWKIPVRAGILTADFWTGRRDLGTA